MRLDFGRLKEIFHKEKTGEIPEGSLVTEMENFNEFASESDFQEFYNFLERMAADMAKARPKAIAEESDIWKIIKSEMDEVVIKMLYDNAKVKIAGTKISVANAAVATAFMKLIDAIEGPAGYYKDNGPTYEAIRSYYETISMRRKNAGRK